MFLSSSSSKMMLRTSISRYRNPHQRPGCKKKSSFLQKRLAVYQERRRTGPGLCDHPPPPCSSHHLRHFLVPGIACTQQLAGLYLQRDLGSFSCRNPFTPHMRPQESDGDHSGHDPPIRLPPTPVPALKVTYSLCQSMLAHTCNPALQRQRQSDL